MPSLGRLGSGIIMLGLLAAGPAHGADRFSAHWTNNLLTLERPGLPGGPLQIWYLEAFLRSGAHDRNWGETTLRHKTTLIAADAAGRRLKFVTRVQPDVEVRHEVRAGSDEVEFRFVLENHSDQPVDLQWFQPACIRVAGFTGANQQSYIDRSFIFTGNGLTRLGDTRRTTNALYLGGQVFVPADIPLPEANPRPLSLDRPSNGLIGCFSSDNRWILATASDRTHELFEGVYVCLHSDPHIGGLRPHEKRRIRAKLYLVPNDPAALLRRYHRDFPGARPGSVF